MTLPIRSYLINGIAYPKIVDNRIDRVNIFIGVANLLIETLDVILMRFGNECTLTTRMGVRNASLSDETLASRQYRGVLFTGHGLPFTG